MKIISLIGLAVFTFSGLLQGQVTLNKGDVYTFEFTAVPSAMGTEPGIRLWMGFTASFSDYNRGRDVIRIDAFENNASEEPWGSVLSNPNFFDPTIASPTHWLGDLQGVVQISMLEGSAVLDSFRIEGEKPSEIGPIIYNLHVVPVPEPATWSLAAVAGLTGLVGWGRSRRQPHS